jgi:hypothetical protein
VDAGRGPTWPGWEANIIGDPGFGYALGEPPVGGPGINSAFSYGYNLWGTSMAPPRAHGGAVGSEVPSHAA